MSIIDIVSFVAGLLLFYLGYLNGPLQWRMARKAYRAIEAMENVAPIELENMRRHASTTRFFSPMSVLFFVVGMVACFPLARVAVQKISAQQLDSVFINTDQLGLSNAEQSLLNAQDPKAVEDAYRRGMQALKMKQYAEAEKGIRQAALGGMSAAQFSLATLYENGFGLPKDGIQACYWYRVAADNKNIDAQKALARPTEHRKGEENKTWEEANC